MNEVPAVLRGSRRCLEEPDCDFSFIANSAFRRAAHDPARDVRSGMLFAVEEDSWAEWAGRSTDFVSSIGMPTEVFASLVRASSHTQSQKDGPSTGVPINISGAPLS